MAQPIGSMSCSQFLDALASSEPTPGGGAVAGVVGATAAALGEMVAGYSLGRAGGSSGDDQTELNLQRISAELNRARSVFLELADEDTAAYAVLNLAFKTPKSDSKRADSIRAGAEAAIQPPLATLATTADLVRLLHELAPISNPSLRSDLAIASRLASSSANAALWNIRANAPLLGEQGWELLAEADTSVGAIDSRCGAIEKSCGGNEDRG